MAYGKNSSQLLLKEGSLKVGTFASYDGNDPQSQFSGDIIGYTKQGSINFENSREYAEFWSNTPGGLVAKDLIKKSMTLNFQVGQFNGDTLKLLLGTKEVVSGTMTNEFLGADEPTQTTHGFLLTTETRDGKKLYIGIFSGKVTTDAVPIALSGTDYAVVDGKIEAFESEIPGIGTDRTINMGFIQFDSA